MFRLSPPSWRRRIGPCFALLAATLAGLWLAGCPSVVRADDEEPDFPEPVSLRLRSEDGLELGLTYYAGTKGKDTVPVVLLHGEDGTRADLQPLAEYLQSRGHAVVVPDQRGHGTSLTVRDPRTGRERQINPKAVSRNDVQNMVRFDMEAIKKYLMDKNNAGELNIRKLCVVGADLGAVVALDWARVDWSWPDLGAMPQGRDVRGLVLLSPPTVAKGYPTRAAMQHPAILSELSLMFVVGDRERVPLAAARQMHATVERRRPMLPDDPEERRGVQDLFLIELETRLQGANLLNNEQLNVEPMIASFIEHRLVRQSIPWSERRQ